MRFRYHGMILHCSFLVLLKIAFDEKFRKENVDEWVKQLEEMGGPGRHLYIQDTGLAPGKTEDDSESESDFE